MSVVTNLDSIRADIKDADHASDEVSNGFEVETADTPRAVHQQHKVGLGCAFTLSVCGRGVDISERHAWGNTRSMHFEYEAGIIDLFMTVNKADEKTKSENEFMQVLFA